MTPIEQAISDLMLLAADIARWGDNKADDCLEYQWATRVEAIAQSLQDAKEVTS